MQDQPITVVHRVAGSSSTAGATEYLAAATADLSGTCVWGLGSGSTIDWPEDTVGQQGSDGVATYLEANPYSIGYLDAGHGQKLNLGEIALLNDYGK